MVTAEHPWSAAHDATISSSENLGSSSESAGVSSGAEMSHWLWLVGLLPLGFLFGYLYLGPLSPQVPQSQRVAKLGITSLLPPKPLDLLLPNEKLSPEQVVATQMGALVAYRDDRRSIHQVFAFASPANQSVTGPLSHFEKMILRPPYDSMVASDHWIAGRVVDQDQLATVLVTTSDKQGKLSLFRFYLSVQSDINSGCWMTDRVICLFQGGLQSNDGFLIESPFVNGI